MQIRSDIKFYDQRFLMFVLDQMANEYEKQNRDVIRMTLGKSELPLHPDIILSMQNALADFNKSSLVFPGGLPQLKEELANYYKEKYKVNIEPKNFIISTGTSTLFRNIFYLLLKKGDEVLLPQPYYSLYHFSALLVGAKIKYYKIDPDKMSLDMGSFIENYTYKTRVVVINTPGNPLGNMLTKQELHEIDTVVNGQSVIINDEIYANICFDEPGTSVMQLSDTKSTFITTNSFSKGYRMYSRRIGYCIVPDELITPLTVLQHHTLLTADPVAQFGAISALKHQKELDYLKNLYKQRRDYTIKRFAGHPLVKALYSKGGFYITLDCRKFMEKNRIADSLDLAIRIMESKGVATVPGSDFGLPHTLRLSFSTSRYNEGIDLLIDFFNHPIKKGSDT